MKNLKQLVINPTFLVRFNLNQIYRKIQKTRVFFRLMRLRLRNLIGLVNIDEKKIPPSFLSLMAHFLVTMTQ